VLELDPLENVMGGLWKKTDHEKSLRKDKVTKVDYVVGFEEGATPPQPTKQPLSIRVTKSGVVIRKSRVWSGSILRDRALKEFRRKMAGIFTVDGCKFSHEWSVDQFALANGLDQEDKVC
jgi:hypothetical protein